MLIFWGAHLKISVYKCSFRIYIIFYQMRQFSKNTATFVRPDRFSTLCSTPIGNSPVCSTMLKIIFSSTKVHDSTYVSYVLNTLGWVVFGTGVSFSVLRKACQQPCLMASRPDLLHIQACVLRSRSLSCRPLSCDGFIILCVWRQSPQLPRDHHRMITQTLLPSGWL